MTQKEIKELQDQIHATEAGLSKIREKVFALTPTAQPQPEPWKRWRAEKGGSYWFVDNYGGIVEDIEQWDGEHGHLRHRLGNYFRTQLLAERHAKRLRSMVPTCAMPKDGEKYWSTGIYQDIFAAKFYIWASRAFEIHLYSQGLVFLDQAAAEAWIAEFGDVWTTRVEGEGE